MGIGRRIKRSMDETLSGFELTWGEWTVLGSLRHEPTNRASPGDLARKHELSSGAMTNRLDRLEEGGFIRRLRNADDRRGVVVELTEEGKRVWHESVDAQAQKEALVTAAALEASEREELNGLPPPADARVRAQRGRRRRRGLQARRQLTRGSSGIRASTLKGPPLRRRTSLHS